MGLLLLVFVIGVQYTSSPSRALGYRHQAKHVGLFSSQKLRWGSEGEEGQQQGGNNEFVHFHPRQKADSPLLQSAQVNQMFVHHQHHVMQKQQPESLYDGHAEYDGRQVPVFRDSHLRADILPPIDGEEVVDDGPPYIPQRRLIHFDLKGLYCSCSVQSTPSTTVDYEIVIIELL